MATETEITRDEAFSKVEKELVKNGFKKHDNTFSLNAKYEGIENSATIYITGIYANTGAYFGRAGKIKGIMLSCGYGKNKAIAKIMVSNFSESVIRKRVVEFKEKCIRYITHGIARTIMHKKEDKAEKDLSSLLTNPRFSRSTYIRVKYGDQYKIEIDDLKEYEAKKIIKMLNDL
jgi:hypothetical protein